MGNEARTSRQKTRQLDTALSSIQFPKRPRGGWVQSIRDALGMNKTQLAKRMNISQAAIAKLEASEAEGGITLSRLQRAADALGCEVVYALKPKSGSLSEMISQQAHQRAKEKLARVNESQALEASALSSDSLAETIADLANEMEVERSSDLWNDD